MTEGVGLSIAKMYLNAAHMQHSSDPLQGARTPTGSSVSLSLSVLGDPKGAGAAMVIKVETSPEDDPPYLLALEMVAIVTQKGETPPAISPRDFVAHGGASMMFPFIREAVANLTMRGAFGPIWLDPVNLQALVESADVKLDDSKVP